MQFIDRAEIEVEGGKGGNGMVAFRKEKYVPAGGPSGGNGGKGGSIYLQAVQNLQTLLDFRYSHFFKANDGKRGGPNNCTGATGKDNIIQVPCGSVIYDLETEEILGDLTTDKQMLCVARGGKGGFGNKHFLSNQNRSPEHALPGLEGEHKILRLELKLLAEVGIIGLPNAGKSTLISSLSAARPKIADYPFTTLTPNLGVVKKPSGDGTVFADIPGLIKGAHEGTGLGYEFLRHIERTSLLLHLIDINAENPVKNYQIIQNELKAYGRGLSDRFQIIALNKIDACDQKNIDATVKKISQLTNAPVFTISSVAKIRTKELLQNIWNYLDLKNSKRESFTSSQNSYQ